jgi:hypothetical protein
MMEMHITSVTKNRQGTRRASYKLNTSALLPVTGDPEITAGRANMGATRTNAGPRRLPLTPPLQ